MHKYCVSIMRWWWVGWAHPASCALCAHLELRD